MRRITVIPCGGAKLDRPAPAAELYIGSMFRDALRTAEHLGNPFFILSAQWGLISPNLHIAPYEQKMGKPGSISLNALHIQLRHMCDNEPMEITSLLPQAYDAALSGAIGGLPIRIERKFLLTRGIGEQKAILKQLRTAGAIA